MTIRRIKQMKSSSNLGMGRVKPPSCCQVSSSPNPPKVQMWKKRIEIIQEYVKEKQKQVGGSLVGLSRVMKISERKRKTQRYEKQIAKWRLVFDEWKIHVRESLQQEGHRQQEATSSLPPNEVLGKKRRVGATSSLRLNIARMKKPKLKLRCVMVSMLKKRRVRSWVLGPESIFCKKKFLSYIQLRWCFHWREDVFFPGGTSINIRDECIECLGP